MSQTTPLNPTPARPIIVGVDGSPSSVRALTRAAHMATALSVPLEAITAWQYPVLYGNMLAPAFVPDPGVLVQVAQAVLDDAVASVFGDSPPDWYRGTVLEGGAAEVLLSASKGAEMLVVGSRGHGGFAGLLLGSVSEAVAAHASCPVLVYHDVPPEAETLPG
jgi:nucleotide-binding universal stress UspA family protein